MPRSSSIVAVVVAVCIALAGCGDSSSEPVARTDTHQLSVGQLARVMASESRVVADHRVALELTELWVDYMLLAEALADDPSAAGVDLSPVVQQQIAQETVVEFRNSVLELDTLLTDVELRQAYNAQATDSEVRIRQILVGWPRGATAAQADSVRQLVTALRDRIVGGGEDFAELAREYSDEEHAAEGGDTGYFMRGEKIDAVDRVAFSLEPGQISDPFESTLGVHLIRVEDRRTPSIAHFRTWLQRQRTNEALATYVVALEAASGATTAEDAVQIVRRIARFPRRPIEGVAEDRALVQYQGGAVTVAEVRQFVLSRPVPFRLTAAAASDQELQGLVLGTMLQSEVLVVEAEAEGVRVSEARRAEIAEEVRQGLVDLGARVGVADVGEDQVEGAVMTALERTTSGAQDVVPLGAYAYALSRGDSVEVVQSGIDQVVREVERLRR